MSPRGPSGASKSLFKHLKNVQFLYVFGSRGLPREPQETQEGSQEEPKELQNPQQKDPKLNPTINNFLTNFGQFFGIKNAQKHNPQKNKINKKTIFGTLFGPACWQLVVPLMSSFGTLFGPAFLHKIPKRFARETTKMSPRGPS